MASPTTAQPAVIRRLDSCLDLPSFPALCPSVEEDDDGMAAWMIAVIALAAAALCVLVVLLLVCVRRMRAAERRKRVEQAQQRPDATAKAAPPFPTPDVERNPIISSMQLPTGPRTVYSPTHHRA
eukprot:gene12991-7112_t